MLVAMLCFLATPAAAGHVLRGAVRITNGHDDTHVEKEVTPLPFEVEVQLIVDPQGERFKCNTIKVSNDLKLIEGNVLQECDGKHLSVEMIMSVKVAGWQQPTSTVVCQAVSCWADIHVTRPDNASPADRQANYQAALESLQRKNLYEATFFLRECSVGRDKVYTEKARAVLNQTNDLSCYPKPTTCRPIWNAPLQ